MDKEAQCVANVAFKARTWLIKLFFWLKKKTMFYVLCASDNLLNSTISDERRPERQQRGGGASKANFIVRDMKSGDAAMKFSKATLICPHRATSYSPNALKPSPLTQMKAASGY